MAGLLRQCPALQVLAASRAPLRIQGEFERPIEPLELPRPEQQSLETLSGIAAIDLFMQRARAVAPHVVLDERSAPPVEARGHALVESLDLISVARDTDRRAMTLTERTQDQRGQITRNRYIVNNRPVIAGTRIPTAAIWNFHDAGYSHEDILKEDPRLTSADIESAIAFEVNARQQAGREIKRAS